MEQVTAVVLIVSVQAAVVSAAAVLDLHEEVALIRKLIV
jgi:hypothetical protein